MSVVVALACAGWFAWKLWAKPPQLVSSPVLECDDPGAHGPGGIWLLVGLDNSSGEALTLRSISVSSHGVHAGERYLVTAPVGAATGVADLSATVPTIWAARREPIGATLRPGQMAELYVHVTWDADVTQRSVEDVRVAYRASSGFFDSTDTGLLFEEEKGCGVSL